MKNKAYQSSVTIRTVSLLNVCDVTLAVLLEEELNKVSCMNKLTVRKLCETVHKTHTIFQQLALHNIFNNFIFIKKTWGLFPLRATPTNVQMLKT